MLRMPACAGRKLRLYSFSVSYSPSKSYSYSPKLGMCRTVPTFTVCRSRCSHADRQPQRVKVGIKALLRCLQRGEVCVVWLPPAVLRMSHANAPCVLQAETSPVAQALASRGQPFDYATTIRVLGLKLNFMSTQHCIVALHCTMAHEMPLNCFCTLCIRTVSAPNCDEAELPLRTGIRTLFALHCVELIGEGLRCAYSAGM